MTKIGEQKTIIYNSYEKMHIEIDEFSEYGWKVIKSDVEIEGCYDGKGCYQGKFVVVFEYVGVSGGK
jgi:hypothetical protein